MLKELDKYRYVHSKSEEISKFAREMSRNAVDTEHIIKNIFSRFDENVEYSRLNSPYYPLQRSDIYSQNEKWNMWRLFQFNSIDFIKFRYPCKICFCKERLLW